MHTQDLTGIKLMETWNVFVSSSFGWYGSDITIQGLEKSAVYWDVFCFSGCRRISPMECTGNLSMKHGFRVMKEQCPSGRFNWSEGWFLLGWKFQIHVHLMNCCMDSQAAASSVLVRAFLIIGKRLHKKTSCPHVLVVQWLSTHLGYRS